MGKWEKNIAFYQGWEAGAGCFWLLGAGAGAAWKKPRAGAGAAWKKKSGAVAAKKLAGSWTLREDKKEIVLKFTVFMVKKKTIILLVLYFFAVLPY